MAILGTSSTIPKVFVSFGMKASVSPIRTSFAIGNALASPWPRISFLCAKSFKSPWPVFATESGLEASISDELKNDMRLGNVKTVVESRDDDKIHIRVDLTEEQTERAFDYTLTNLARTAPPIPGFRRTKGGKTSNVPKSFLLQILGRDRVTKFLIQELVSLTIGDFVKKEDLKVKNQFKTIQTGEELEAAFTPGSEFGFDAALDFEKSEPEASSPAST